MNNKQKKALYESIMKSVAKTIKKALNNKDIISLNENTGIHENDIVKACEFLNKFMFDICFYNTGLHKCNISILNVKNSGFPDWDNIYDPGKIKSISSFYVNLLLTQISFKSFKDNEYTLTIGVELNDTDNELWLQQDMLYSELFFNVIYNVRTNELTFGEKNLYLKYINESDFSDILNDAVSLLKNATNGFIVDPDDDSYADICDSLENDGINGEIN